MLGRERGRGFAGHRPPPPPFGGGGAGERPASGANAVTMKSTGGNTTLKELKAQAIQIAGLYGPRADKLSSLLDRLIAEVTRTTRTTRTNGDQEPQAHENTLKKLEAVTERLEKVAKKEEEQQNKSDTWATVAKRAAAKPSGRVDAAIAPTRPPRKELEVAIKVTGQTEIQTAQRMTAEEIVKRARGAGEEQGPRKDILAARYHQSGIIVLKVSNEESRHALEKDKSWVKDICGGADLKRNVYPVIVHGVRVKGIPAQGEGRSEEVGSKLEGMNTTFHPGLKIVSARWISKDSCNKDFSSMVLNVADANMANRLIQHGLLYEYQSRVVEYYEPASRIHQCFKCQGYGHMTYRCPNKQACGYCAGEHPTADCEIKEQQAHHRCGACKGKHVAWHPECPARKSDWKRSKETLKNKPMLHASSAAVPKTTFSAFTTPVSIAAVMEGAKKRKVTASTTQRGRPTNEVRQKKQSETQSQAVTMERMLEKKSLSAIEPSHSSKQETLTGSGGQTTPEEPSEPNDQEMIEAAETQEAAATKETTQEKL